MVPLRRNELAAIAAALLLAFTVFRLIDAPAPVTSADFAAWAQGIGTIAAVAVTAWIGLLPHRAEQKRQMREQRAFHEVVRLAASEIMEPVEGLHAALGARDIKGFELELSRLRERPRARPLRRILAEPATQWSSMEVYLCATQFQRAAAELAEVRMPPEAARHPRMANDFWPTATKLADECRLCMDALVARMAQVEGAVPASGTGATPSIRRTRCPSERTLRRAERRPPEAETPRPQDLAGRGARP